MTTLKGNDLDFNSKTKATSRKKTRIVSTKLGLNYNIYIRHSTFNDCNGRPDRQLITETQWVNLSLEKKFDCHGCRPLKSSDNLIEKHAYSEKNQESECFRAFFCFCKKHLT